MLSGRLACTPQPAWEFGRGAIQNAIPATQAPDNTARHVGNLTFEIEVWVGGVPAATYNGRSSCCSGLDEIAARFRA